MIITKLLKFDWFVQSLMIILALMSLAMGLDAWKLFAIALMCWQPLSVAVLLIITTGRDLARWGFVIGYMVYLLTDVLCILVPILITGYWLLTTYNVFRQRNHSGNFLRHTSF